MQPITTRAAYVTLCHPLSQVCFPDVYPVKQHTAIQLLALLGLPKAAITVLLW